MPQDIFDQIAPDTGKKSAKPQGDIFDQIAIPKGKGAAQDKLPDLTNEDIKRAGKFALGMLPAAGATAAAIFQPELLPVAAGFLPETAAATGAAAAGGLAGSLAQQGIQSATGMEERPRSLGEFGRRTATEAAEQGAMELGGRLVSGPVGFVAKKFLPESLYGRALKPSTTLPVGERQRVIQTGLREGIPASAGGYDKLISSIQDLTGEIDKKLAAKSQNLGDVINPQTVARRLDALEDRFRTQGYPDEDVNTIKKVRESFLKRHSYEAPYTKIRPGSSEEAGAFVPVGKGTTRIYEPMTLAEAQAEKRGTYRYNEWRKNATPHAQEQAEKALARGLKEEIAGLFPEVSKLNARDSDMLALEEQLRRFVGRESNKNIVGLIPAAMGAATGLFGAGDALSGNKERGGAEAVLGLALLALDNKEIQSKLAISLAKAARQRIGPITVGAAASRLGKEAIPAAARGVKAIADQGQ